MKKLLVVLLCAFSAFSWEPLFENDFNTIEVGGIPFKNLGIPNTAGCPSPTIVDVDQDGLQDILVAIMYYGNIVYLKNEGTKSKPRFDTLRYLESGGDNNFSNPV